MAQRAADQRRPLRRTGRGIGRAAAGRRPAGQPVQRSISVPARLRGRPDARTDEPAAAQCDAADAAPGGATRRGAVCADRRCAARHRRAACCCARARRCDRDRRVGPCAGVRARAVGGLPADLGLHRRAAAAAPALARAHAKHRGRELEPGAVARLAIDRRAQHRRHRAGAAQLRLRIVGAAGAARRRRVRRRPAVLSGRHRRRAAAPAASARG
jgi:hypothetical protein